MEAAGGTPSPVDYTIARGEEARLKFLWRFRKNPAGQRLAFWFGVLLGIAGVTIVAIEYDRARRSHSTALEHGIELSALALFLMAVGIAIYAVCEARRSGQPLQRRVAFRANGIEFTTRGDVETIRWYAVGDAYDLGEAYGISRRDDSRNPIVIPKSALTNGGAELWEYIELRLTGRRPAVRDLGFPAPSHFENTVDQFLADRSVTA